MLSAIIILWIPFSPIIPPLVMVLRLMMKGLVGRIYWLLNRWYFRRERVLQDFRYLKRGAFLHFLTLRSSKHLVYLDDSVQLLQYEVPCPIAVKKCHYTLAFCKFCHRFVDPCTFYCNGIVITCAQKIDDVCPSFHQYYPGRVENPRAAGQLCFSKACELARLAC